MAVPSFPEAASASSTGEEAGFKSYPSFYLPLEVRERIITELAALIGPPLQASSRVIAIREAADGFILYLDSRTGLRAVSARTIIFAGGRFGPIELTRMAPHLPMIFRRFEVGVRLEQPVQSFLFSQHPSLDVKQITEGRTEGEEWRTFCTCRDGEVIEARWDALRVYSGRADGAKTGVSNIGLNLRLTSFPVQPDLYSELHDVLTGNTEPFRCVAEEFLHDGSVFYGPQLDRRFREHLRAMLSPELIGSAVVHGPCVEGVGFYPDVTNSLKVNSHDIWVAGDSSGLFRGLTAAMVSGYYCSLQVTRYLRDRGKMPAFIKESPSRPMPVIFTAQSKAYFYCRDAVCEYVINQNMLPLNPFRVFEYFLGDRVSRDLVRRGNNQLIASSDELWVFGPVSDGVLFEIVRARQLRKPVRFFSIATRAGEIRPLPVNEVKFEPEVHAKQITREDLLALLNDTLSMSEPALKQLSLFHGYDFSLSSESLPTLP